MPPPDPGSRKTRDAPTWLWVVTGVSLFLLGLSFSDWPDFVDRDSPHRQITDVARALGMIGMLGLMIWTAHRGRTKPRALAEACSQILNGAVTGVPARAITGRASAIPPQVSSLPGAQGHGWIHPLEVALPDGQARAFAFSPYEGDQQGQEVTVLVHPERRDAAVITTGGDAWANVPRPTGYISDWARLKPARLIAGLVMCALLGHLIGLWLGWQVMPIR